ncbi:MAG: VWA domain-containing protein [Alphaproteobacteria bacterium]|nr:VWA domain-containing protein [Alphaproteobacteria bacterium]
MSCGLGAIILVLMLVKHDVEHVSDESERLTADMERLKKAEEQLSAEVANTLRSKAATTGEVEALEFKISKVQREIDQTRIEITARRGEEEDLEETIKTIEVKDNTDVVENRQVGEENYLIGLKVEGKRIGILIDSSASMMDEKLVDIIRQKNMRASARAQAPKWRRTRRVANWLLARVPSDSLVGMVSFNETARKLGNVSEVSGKDAAGLGHIAADLNEIIPGGPTNLAAGLKAIKAFNPTDIYVVTDGLPTAGDSGYRSLNPFSGCSALWGGATSISGECRARLFRHTIDNSGLMKVRTNVILLPLEGDPEAAVFFWRWSALTGGLTISPAGTWP